MAGAPIAVRRAYEDRPWLGRYVGNGPRNLCRLAHVGQAAYYFNTPVFGLSDIYQRNEFDPHVEVWFLATHFAV